MRTMPGRDARSLDHATLEEMRRLAIRRIEAGEKQTAVADSLEVNRRTVRKWIRAYRQRGAEALASRKAPGREPALDDRQVARLRRIILGKDPRQMNFGSAFWTLPVVGSLVREVFGVSLHRSTVGRVLDRMGLTPQVPLARAFQRDEEDIRRWAEERFPEIVREARRKQAVLLFLDETGVQENPPLPTTWAVRGETPVVRVSGARRKGSVISAVSPRGRIWFRCFKGNLNAERFVGFLDDLQREFSRRVVLVTDKHPAHVAARTVRYLKTVRSRISVHFLPSYAPELNPDEHVWSYLKYMLRSDPVRKGERIEDKVEQSMRSIQAVPRFVRRFFKDPNVAYVRKALGW